MSGSVAIVLAVLSATAMMAASRFALHHAVALSTKLDVPPFLVGISLLAVGTDIPEITSCLVAASMGQGDFVVGDAIGSVFTMATLVLGAFPLIAVGSFAVSRREVLPIAGLTVAVLLLGIWTVRDGNISRPDGALMVVVWIAATAIIWNLRETMPDIPPRVVEPRGVLWHGLLSLLGLAVVGGAAIILVRSVVALSEILGIPQYVISFFGASVGTSLPELVVEYTALRRRLRELALGDVLGSCLVDSSLSIGIGPLLFPVALSPELALRGGTLAVASMLLVAALLGIRRRHDYLSGLALTVAYLLGYAYMLG
jgi:cation:H+ antiporter